MGRARGSGLKLAGAFESTPGTPPGSGYYTIPIVSTTIGEERGLIASDLIGTGREMQDPTYDVANDVGDFVVPVDNRNFGRWLKLLLGAPSSSGTPGHATGSWTFSDRPTNGSTITVNGVVFTFVTAGVTGNQIGINPDLASTMATAASRLNASTIPAVAVATYSATGTTLVANYDAAGPDGNSFTMAAGSSPASNATPSGATLTGGTAATHIFTSGAASLPSMAIEVGHPEVPSYHMHRLVRANTLKISASRSGLLNATMSVIAQGEADPTTSSAAGSPTSLAAVRFAQATGYISRDGLILGEVVSFDFTATNNLETIETIVSDGRIADADPGMFGITLSVTVKFSGLTMLNLARNGTPCQLTFGWSNGPYSLLFNVPRTFLPVPKRPISGPNGVQAQYDAQASGPTTNSLTVTLVNDLPNYTA